MVLCRHDRCCVQDTTTSQWTELKYSRWNMNSPPSKMWTHLWESCRVGPHAHVCLFLTEIWQLEITCSLYFHPINFLSTSFTLPSMSWTFSYHQGTIIIAPTRQSPFILCSMSSVNQFSWRSASCTWEVASLLQEFLNCYKLWSSWYNQAVCREATLNHTVPPQCNADHIGMLQKDRLQRCCNEWYLNWSQQWLQWSTSQAIDTMIVTNDCMRDCNIDCKEEWKIDHT
jgi:hypothetical protein